MNRAWYDCFHNVFYRQAEEAEAARSGGNKVTELTTGNFRDVQAFHDKFGLSRDRPARPSFPADDLARFRLGFLLEELAEFASASGARPVGLKLKLLAVEARTAELYAADRNLVGAFDALLDLSVVTLGTADFHGLPWEAGWDAVLERNLAKRRAKPDGSDSKRGSPHDVVKPEGWHGPEAALAALLDAADLSGR